MRFETRAVHAGGEPDPETGAIAPPVHLSTTFEHGPAGEARGGHIYVRESNPTQTRLEEALAQIEGGEAALVFASGVSAGAAYLQALEPDSHVLFHSDIYYAFRTMANEYLPRWGLEASFVDMTDLGAVRAAVRPHTRLFWIETPTNPLIQVLDLRALTGEAARAGARVLVDGTFATPALQRPLELGADVVLHSTTKYLGGHSDLLGGALVFRARDEMTERVQHNRHILGPIASPFASWMVLRGLRTLACRVERQSANALAIAKALDGHPGLRAVHYPGLPSSPGHEIAKRQMSAFGAMMSLRVAGGREGALRVARRVRLFTNATSLGSVESLLEHRVSVESPDTATPDDLLRLSIGLEHEDDLIEDLRQALDREAS
ncbi:MAG: trans-sulfuration enzyme family protein [Bacteroidota bacterium]